MPAGASITYPFRPAHLCSVRKHGDPLKFIMVIHGDGMRLDCAKPLAQGVKLGSVKGLAVK